METALPDWQDDGSRDAEETMTDGGHWWESFFEGLWLEYQLGPRIEAEGARRAQAIAKLLGLGRGSRVLDAPCGEGRIARGLAALGCDVTGVDLSKVMLTEGHHRATAAGASVRFERNDLRRLPYRSEFDAVVCYWGSFGYFDDVGNLEQMRAAAEALVPGGVYLIDGHVTETLLPQFTIGEGPTHVGEFTIDDARRWNAEEGRVESTWTLKRGDQTEVRKSSIRIYSIREMTHLLREAGFTSLAWHGSVFGEPYALGTNRGVVVATR